MLRELKASKTEVLIPPGHLLVFADTVLHEIVSKKLTYVSMRQFLGWRLTTTDSYLLGDDFEDHMHAGAIIRMKSGQLPCMYAKLHLVNWVKQLEEFSAAAFPPDMLQVVSVAGVKRLLVPRFLPSLEALGMRQVYDPYTAEELAIFKPALLLTDATEGGTRK